VIIELKGKYKGKVLPEDATDEQKKKRTAADKEIKRNDNKAAKLAIDKLLAALKPTLEENPQKFIKYFTDGVYDALELEDAALPAEDEKKRYFSAGILCDSVPIISL
jgi:hypothetical protein